MSDAQFIEILGKCPKMLELGEKQFYQWIESLTKAESKEFAKGVADQFSVDEREFLKKLLTYQILKAKPWVEEKDIDLKEVLP